MINRPTAAASRRLGRIEEQEAASFGWDETRRIPITDDPMAHDSGSDFCFTPWSRVWAMPFAAMISRLPSAIAEGSAWPPNRLLPMIQSKNALEKLLLISGQWVVAPTVTMSPKGGRAS